MKIAIIVFVTYVVVRFFWGWITGFSRLVYNIQKRLATPKGYDAFVKYVDNHYDIMRMSLSEIPNSIRFVYYEKSILKKVWLFIEDGIDRKRELKNIYNAIK